MLILQGHFIKLHEKPELRRDQRDLLLLKLEDNLLIKTIDFLIVRAICYKETGTGNLLLFENFGYVWFKAFSASTQIKVQKCPY
ncbi:unnamed protein product [Microthlaspi erraticum]|uniref:Uncharacterized protein n=1 Tax=Microthlaspi erraticum TaxID=1685480 RepID=A0A6D2L5R0_9BRAS|nr:unnamed protein product [Microthlaspi erraticum]